MTVFATQSSIQFSAPGLAGRAAAGAGKSKLLTASELRGLLGTGSAGLGAKYLADDSTWKSIDLTAYATTAAVASGYQPLDSDLTAIAGLTATTDNFIQSKAGAWASRTVAQVQSDLGLATTYVPYTGATGAVNFGVNALTVGAITASDRVRFAKDVVMETLGLPISASSLQSFRITGATDTGKFVATAIDTTNNYGVIAAAKEGVAWYDMVIGLSSFGLPIITTKAVSQGRVGINNTAPSCALDVTGAITASNGTSPTSIRVHSTYTSSTSYGRLGIIANAGQTAYEISSDKGSAGGANLPINIGHRDSAGTFTSALSVATNGSITASGTITGRASTTAAGTAPVKIPTGVLMTTPEAGAIEFNGSALSFTAVDVRRSIVVGNDIRVSDTTVANTVTETVLHTSAIAANAMAVGKMYKLTILGKFSTANGAAFFTLRSKMGGTTLLTAIKDVGVVVDEHFRSEFWLTIRTIGVSGTYAAHLESTLGTEIESTSPVTGSVDTTVVEDLTLTVEWSAANAGNTITVMQSVLEVIN